ncbi:MAG: OmpH family outer membrane protein [Bacteroidota bacterium]
MKAISILIKTLLVVGLFSQVQAQKIGHANIELILAYMPETKSMQEQVNTYEAKLGEKLKIKEDYARTKVQEYQEKAQGGATAEALQPLEGELQKLQQEIQQERATASQQAMIKRQELMTPITEKVGAAIKKIADANGFAYILNTTDGSGMSIVLHGPEENDMTKAIMDELGVKIPESGSASE